MNILAQINRGEIGIGECGIRKSVTLMVGRRNCVQAVECDCVDDANRVSFKEAWSQIRR